MSFTDLKIKEEDFKGRNIQSIDTDTVIGRADELKRLFDAPAQEVLKEKINALIEHLESEQAAEEIGAPEIADGSGNTVAEQIGYLFREMQNIYAGGIIDGSIQDVKLSNEEGQIKQTVAEHKKKIGDLDSAPNNSVVRWTSFVEFEDDGEQIAKETKCFDYIEPNIGAFHLSSAESDPEFGLLPVNCGGTGADNPVGMKHNFGIVKKLWDGSWTSGKITVPNWRDYSMFTIVITNAASPILLIRYNSVLRGIGGSITDGGIWTMSGNFTINADDTWQYGFAGFMGHTSASNHNTVVNNEAVIAIWGIV